MFCLLVIAVLLLLLVGVVYGESLDRRWVKQHIRRLRCGCAYGVQTEHRIYACASHKEVNR